MMSKPANKKMLSSIISESERELREQLEDLNQKDED